MSVKASWRNVRFHKFKTLRQTEEVGKTETQNRSSFLSLQQQFLPIEEVIVTYEWFRRTFGGTTEYQNSMSRGTCSSDIIMAARVSQGNWKYT